MIIIDFIKSLFIPKKMQKFRYMSIFISICLFFISSYALQIPVKNYYEKNFNNLVSESDLGYFSVFDQIPTAGSNISNFVNDIKNTNLVVDGEVLKSNDLGLKSITYSDNIIGVITKNLSNGHYIFNGVDTQVAFSTINFLPSITTVDGGIVIDNASNNVVSVSGVTSSNSVSVIKISTNSINKLMINDVTYDYYVDSHEVNVKVENGEIIVNNFRKEIEVDDLVLIYFEKNNNVTYFERNLTFLNDSGVVTNLKFIVDLSQNGFDYQKLNKDGLNYDNEEYFYIILDKTTFNYQAHPNDLVNYPVNNKEVTSFTITNYLYQINFSLDDFNVSNFGSYMKDILRTTYITYIVGVFSVSTLFHVVIIPIIISLIYFFTFRKQGRMKSLKEYYNIASIANISAFIVTFVSLWFVPEYFSYVYIISFGLWFLYICYKINNLSEIV